MLTEFGKAIRKIRLDKGRNIKRYGEAARCFLSIFVSRGKRKKKRAGKMD